MCFFFIPFPKNRKNIHQITLSIISIIPNQKNKCCHLCQGRSTPCIGDGKNPTFNDGILISWVNINPYGLGLMSLSPIIWKCHGSWSTRSHIFMSSRDGGFSGHPDIVDCGQVVPMSATLLAELEEPKRSFKPRTDDVFLGGNQQLETWSQNCHIRCFCV